MKQTVFLYRNAFGSVCAMTDNDDYLSCGNVRISEYVEVEFPERNQGEIIATQVAAMDEAMMTLMEKIKVLQTQKADLLALGSEVGHE